MKSNLTYLFILFYYFAYSQVPDQDGQWYITESYEVSADSRTPNLEEFILEGVLHPDPSPTMNADGNTGVGRNDVFIIYDDGTYYNSRENPFTDSNWSEDDPEILYYFSNNSSRHINYMYFTNVYEGQDLPPKIIPNPDPDAITDILEFPTLTTTDIFSINHAVVENTDIILAVKNPDEFPEEGQSSSCEYQLCYTTQPEFKGGNNTQTTSPISPLVLEECNIFGNDLFVLYGNDEVLMDTCLIYTPNLNVDFSFINLRVPDQLSDENLNSSIRFNVKPIGECFNAPTFSPITEQVNLAHDPNFVQVRIGLNDDGEKVAKYHVECYNDKPNADVETLRFKLLMPGHLDLGTMKPTASYLGLQQPEMLISGRFIEPYIDSNIIDLIFKENEPPGSPASKDLGGYNPNYKEKSTGWVEFEIDLPQVADPAHINLKPIYAKSYFDNLMFHIVEYRDKCRTIATPKKKGFLSSCFSSCFCGDQASRDSNMDRWSIDNNNDINDCCRISSGACVTSTAIANSSGSHLICWLIMGLIVLMFIFFILWLQRLFGKGRRHRHTPS